MGQATKMRILILSGNNISGPIPTSISNMLELMLLDLSSNRFSGNKFPMFNPNSLLLYADLSSNKLSGQVPTTFSLGIKVLLLSQNEFSHVLPQNLSNLNQLEYLDLHSNNIGGEIPNFLSQMSSLQILNLRNNSSQGSIPIHLSSLSTLQILDFSSNNLSEIIPHTLESLSRMINHHDVSSSISSNVTSQIIVIPENWFLIHTISIAKQTDLLLHDLEVFWKKLNRGLPNKNLKLYTFLDLSNNQFSGEIPNSSGGLKNLKSLNLSQNKLSGRIPLSFGGLQSLESIDISHNNLFGESPYTLANLFELSYLDLSNNKLEGRIPSGPQMDRMNDPNSYANNNGLCGMQIKVSCEKVPSHPKLKEERTKKRSWETWFSWNMA
ncbi:hypothetical protein GH714_034932 [Hevea brasiliensis]|uniref:Leucine-rich repeat-containing N-terminal plant-type domain-containing protein n=1 Tax=Hevea brasiliensis TaxID=3981 RepID=A0A6A6L3F0_HEVBR|nr:hypothetical protein GH714_034932 [Hevea brasiliensis]